MKHRHFWLLIQATVSVAMLVMLFRSFDLGAFGDLFTRVPLWFYVISLAVILSGQLAYAWRWRVILVSSGVPASFSAVVQQYFVAIAVNNFFPSTVGGDVAKVVRLGRDHGYRQVGASVLLDRLLGLGLLALCAAATLWLLPVSSVIAAGARGAVTAVAGMAIVVLGMAAVGTGGLPDRVAWMGRRAVGLAAHLQDVRSDMATPLRSPMVVVQAAAVVVGYVLAVTWLYVEFLVIQTGVRPSFAMVGGAVMAIAVLSNIPISVNGLGLREQLHVALLGPIGVVPEVAGAISLLLFGHLIIASLIGLVFWIRSPAASSAPDSSAQPDA